MFLEEQQRFAPVADNHPNDAVVDGIAGRDCVNVDLGGAQGIANARESARAVIQKER
jgi:hypothetical protein